VKCGNVKRHVLKYDCICAKIWPVESLTAKYYNNLIKHFLVIAEFAGLENARLEFGRLENDGLNHFLVVQIPVTHSLLQYVNL